MKKIGKLFLQFLPYLFMLIAIILIVQLTVSIKTQETPTIFGRAVFVVASPSMEDTIMTGDVIFVDTDATNFHIGDIISFRKPDQPSVIITHRIVAIENIGGVNYYTTKGDNNEVSGDWETRFDGSYIVGKYTSKSAFLGMIYKAFFPSENEGYSATSIIFTLIIFVFAGIGIFEIVNLVRIFSVEKNRKELDEEKNKLIQIEYEKLKKMQDEKDKS